MECPESEENGPRIPCVGLCSSGVGHVIDEIGIYVLSTIVVTKHAALKLQQEKRSEICNRDQLSSLEERSDLSSSGEARVVARTASPATG